MATEREVVENLRLALERYRARKSVEAEQQLRDAYVCLLDYHVLSLRKLAVRFVLRSVTAIADRPVADTASLGYEPSENAAGTIAVGDRLIEEAARRGCERLLSVDSDTVADSERFAKWINTVKKVIVDELTNCSKPQS